MRDGRFGSTAELHDTPEAAAWAAGIRLETACQRSIPDPKRPLTAVVECIYHTLVWLKV